MLSQLVLLQLTALVATASAVGIPVNVLVGKDLGDEDDDKGTRCWSPEKVEESKRNEEQFWKDQSRIAEDPRWSTAWDFYFATARTTDLSQEDMSSFMALESSMMLEYHSTNPYFWTYTSFRQSDETNCGDEGKHAETRIRDETATPPKGQGASALSSTTKTASGLALATSVSSKVSSDSAVASAIATANAGASNNVFKTYAAAALVAVALL